MTTESIAAAPPTLDNSLGYGIQTSSVIFFVLVFVFVFLRLFGRWHHRHDSLAYNETKVNVTLSDLTIVISFVSPTQSLGH